MKKKLRIVGIENIEKKIPPGTTARELAAMIKSGKLSRDSVIQYLLKRRRAHLLKKSKGQRKGFSWPSLVLLTDLLGMEKLGSASREEMEKFMCDYDIKK